MFNQAVYPEAIDDRLVLCWVRLDAALHHVQWSDQCVGNTTGQETSKAAESVVFSTAIFAAIGL